MNTNIRKNVMKTVIMTTALIGSTYTLIRYQKKKKSLKFQKENDLVSKNIPNLCDDSNVDKQAGDFGTYPKVYHKLFTIKDKSKKAM